MCLCSKIGRRMKSDSYNPTGSETALILAHFSTVIDCRRWILPASSLDAILTRLVPQRSLHKNRSSSSQNTTITTSRQSLTICSLAQTDRRQFANFNINTCPRFLKVGDSSSGPAALHLLRIPITMMTCISDEGSVSACTGSR